MPAPHFFAQNGGVGLFDGAGVALPLIAGKSYKFVGSRVQTCEQKFRIRFEDGSGIGSSSGTFRIKTGSGGAYQNWTVNSGEINIWNDQHLGRAGRGSWSNNGDYDLPHGWVNAWMRFHGSTGGSWDGNDRIGYRVSSIAGPANNSNIGQMNIHSGWNTRDWNSQGQGATRVRRHAGNFQDEDFGNEQGQTNHSSFKIRFY